MRRFAIAAVLVVAAVLLLPPLAHATASGPQKTTCVQVFERERTCSEQFIPALVDARRSVNRPQGIAQGNRDEIVTQAFAEWAEDSKDAAIDNTCTRLVLTNKTPAGLASCLQQTGCDGFVQCVIPAITPSL